MPPTVAIIGRPNVGKSTLFNRLSGLRRAITHDLPGVTRDRVAGEAERPRGGVVVLVDTGGFEPETEELIPRLVRGQAKAAIQQAEAVLFVVDGSAGLLPADLEIADVLRRTGPPVLVVVNKADRRDARLGAGEFSSLGFDVVALSAEHGIGIVELWDWLEARLPEPEDEEEADPELGVAIIGRPNVGKSSLLNCLLGEERVMVSEVAGTTRDVVDTILESDGRRVRLLDTAGIRRRGRTDRGPEVLSVVMARRAIERAHVCLLLVDAAEGITAQDTHVAGLVHDAGRAVVVVINKVDLVAGGGVERRRLLVESVLNRLKFFKDTPVAVISAATGEGVSAVLPRMWEAGEAFRRRVGTGELNRVLRRAWEQFPPPGGRRPPRLFYATQVGSAPPRFAIFCSAVDKLHFSYIRYLENVVREAFSFPGVPIRFIMRAKQGRSR